jgi:phosphatidylserine decarboxylase
MSTPVTSQALSWRDELLFLVTNRLPRHALSRAMGWLSKIESPLLARLALAVWRRFDGDFRLHEARRESFDSIHAIFTRQLKPGARPLDARLDAVLSPCDALLGAHGVVEDGRAYQAKGYPYQLIELLGDAALAEKYRDGVFVTLRLKSSMYHRFHAPIDGRLERVLYLAGDRWNVHPPALKKIEKLYCRNERAVVECLGEPPGRDVCLVAVAAILVSSIRLHCLGERPAADVGRTRDYRVDTALARGDELGYFEHGSTIVVLAQQGFRLCEGLDAGDRIFMGQALLEPHRQPLTRGA